MEQEIISKIFDAILDLKTDVSGLKTDVAGLKTDGSSLKTTVAKIESTQDKMLIHMLNMDAKMDTFATKEELQTVKGEIMITVDSFVKLHETLDQEFVAVRHRYDRLEERLVVVESK